MISAEQRRKELNAGIDETELGRLRVNTHTGRPLGSDSFISKLEKLLGRRVRPLPVGRPTKERPKSQNRKGKSVAVPNMPFVTLIVQPDGVKLVSAFWHDIEAGSGRHSIEDFDSRDMGGAVQALRRFYPGIEDMPNVEYVRPVYNVFDPDTTQPEIVWDVYFENGKHVFWDSDAEEAPDLFKSQRKQRQSSRH